MKKKKTGKGIQMIAVQSLKKCSQIELYSIYMKQNAPQQRGLKASSLQTSDSLLIQ